jgi:hypothetical protein
VTATSAAYVRRVLDLFAQADIRDELLWFVDGHQVVFHANVSDVFEWGCADAEPITPDRLPDLERSYADLAAVGALECLAELYAARLRGMRPQGAAYPSKAGVCGLFDACGPEREIGILNPRRHPRPKEQQS